jgi:hypothetical protein
MIDIKTAHTACAAAQNIKKIALLVARLKACLLVPGCRRPVQARHRVSGPLRPIW